MTFSLLYSEFPFSVLIFCAILGSIIGSFLSVCIFRIPYGRPKGPPSFEEMNGLPEAEGGQESSTPDPHLQNSKLGIGDPPRSFCPHCRNKLFWWHNIPVISWLLLKGRCYFCKERISFRYPLVELLSAAFAVAAVYSFGLSYTALIVYLYCACLIVISFIDIEYYIIPDVISFPGMAAGLMLGVFNNFYSFLLWPFPQSFWGNLVGILFGGGVLLFISEVYFRIRKRVGLGLGDVKLLAMTGAFFGFEGAFCTMFYGSLLGSVIGLSIMLFMRKSLTHHLPFGPYLALGTVFYIFSGPKFIFQF